MNTVIVEIREVYPGSDSGTLPAWAQLVSNDRRDEPHWEVKMPLKVWREMGSPGILELEVRTTTLERIAELSQ